MTLRVVSSKDFKELINSNELIVVDFYADWCGPCRMLSPNIEKLSEEYKNIKFAKVNVDDCSELAQELGITSIPAVFFFKDAKVINSFVGFKPYEEIKINWMLFLQFVVLTKTSIFFLNFCAYSL